MSEHMPWCEDEGADVLPHLGGSDGVSCICFCPKCHGLTVDHRGALSGDCICPDCRSDHHGHQENQ